MTQSAQALANANTVRRQRQQIVNDVRTKGRLEDGGQRRSLRARASCMSLIAQAIEARFDAIRTMKTWDLLALALRDHEIRILLKHAGITNEYRILGHLTDRQIELLTHSLRSPSLLWSQAR